VTDSSLPRSGYTLPVFASAAALAALHWLRHGPPGIDRIPVRLIEPEQTVNIPVEQVAGLSPGVALAITRSDPGDNLDLTRQTPIWAMVGWGNPEQTEPILLQGGEGVGWQTHNQTPAIYAYAHRLMQENLSAQLHPGERLQVTIILPEGRALAQRTSNAAFGVVEGLSLLGTTGIAQPLSAPQQLDLYRDELRQKAQKYDCLVFCLGENGLDLALRMGIEADRRIKTANWLGPLLVEAGLQGIESILLFGYHGKLIKLAGGIFHTHHHLADARQEILTAHCAVSGLPPDGLQAVLASATAEAALKYLRQLDHRTDSDWVRRVYGVIAQKIDERSQTYIQIHSECEVQVGSVLFDRNREIILTSPVGTNLLAKI